MEHFAALKPTRCSAFFRARRRKARLFFHLETFCLTSTDLQPRMPWKQRGRARPRSVPSVRTVHGYFGEG